jgi:2-iminobutanoate/2-iminopropanoate deaminase
MDRRVIHTAKVPPVRVPLSQAIKAGDWIFVSGQLGTDPTTGSLAIGGVAAETKQVCENMKSILEAAGSSLAKVVRAVIYMADLRELMEMNQVFSAYFPSGATMFTYQVRPRTFRHEPERSLVFPAQCEIRFHFQPLQPFGLESTGGRTAVRAVAASALFNANTGEHTIESTEPLRPIDVTVEEPIRKVHLTGNVLSISQHVESGHELAQMVEGIYFLLPLLLNVPFADPPYVERVDGTVGASPFRWELSDWRMEFRTTTQEAQESAAAQAWTRLQVLAPPDRRRLIAGLHHFHTACRLARRGSTAGEFVAEVILNLAKTLEVLFPPGGDGRTRDAARSALRQLGFGDAQIEGDFIPAMALRNEIDVGHVELGLFTMDQLKIIHAFTERAEGAFRDLLDRLLSQVESGGFAVAPYTATSARPEAVALIERLRQRTPPEAV